MGFSLDFSELEQFGKIIDNLYYSFDDFLKDFLIEMAERVISRTKKRTPVDTGALRRSWTLGNVYGQGKSLEVEILNGMDYATEIEYGHRIMGGPGNNTELGWFEGRFMLKISIDEIRKQMPLRYEKEFKLFCKNKGLII